DYYCLIWHNNIWIF
nr:immunoglobulin light chain junction region [Macaca mulatta]MOX77588.1 immunoglobulin light chain junction region [Macaca mulatta]MOX78155.1 immunoglobulin light chain junction region [Macaca mulatta]MOX81633.1 immunoglobulin light chain junction region [Macaca mulatta]